jgi:hypothetical protein
MGAESIAQADDSPVAQIRKLDKVEALDVALLDVPVKETIGSPDSVLSASLQKNSSEVASKAGVESFTIDNLNNVNGSDNAETGMSRSTEATTKEVDKDADVEVKQTSSEVAGGALQDALPPAVEVKEDSGEEVSVIKTDDAVLSPILIVQSSTAKESMVHEMQEMEDISLEDGQKNGPFEKGISLPASQPASSVSKLAEKFNSVKQSAPISEEAGESSKQNTTVLKKAISAPASQSVMNISKLMENFSNTKQSVQVSEEAEGSSKHIVTILKKAISAPASQPVVNISKLVESFSNSKQSTPVLDEAEVSSKQSATVPKEDQRTEPIPSTADLKVAEGNINEDALKVVEGNIREDASKAAEVNKKAPVVELQPVTTEIPVAESQAKAEVPKAVERTEREDKLAALAASAIEALPSSRFARGK